MNDIESPPSVFKINLLEFALSIIVGAAMVWSFRNVLWTAEPWYWQFQPSDSYPEWFIQSRDALFVAFGWFMFLLGFVASVCLIRFVRRQVNEIPNFGRISFHGYLLLTWPLILLVPDLQTLFVVLFICSLPAIVFGSLMIFILFRKNIPFSGNAVPVVINLFMVIPFAIYSAGLWALTGD